MEAPFGVYPTSDGWVTIAMSPYEKLVGVLGDESLLAYDNPHDLFEKRDEIWEKLAALTSKWKKADLMAAMLAVDIWCGEVKTHLEAAEDPQVEHLGAIGSYEHPTAGHVKVVAPAVKLSATPATIRDPAPLVGQHSREILAEFGYGEAEIADLLAREVIGESKMPERD
jgi:crotonobetainyl-CoA:carnitine CoA-transferase CaiB-like acyl-CoA transferase